MQLKTLGESTTALSKLKEALQQIDTNGTVGMPRMAEENRLLAEAFSGCSMEATKMAITQSSLNQTQIEAILKQKGLKGEILETTAADLANAASVNAVAAAEKKATASTIGFGAAVKGLGVALKNLVIAHPIVATITVIGTAIALYAQFGNTLKNLQKKAKESKQEYDDVTTEIKRLNDELKTTKDRIEELQNKDVLTIVEQEELDKLKETNDELERELRIKEAIAQRKGQDAADKAEDAITKKSENYNGHYAINDPDMTLQDNPYVYDKGDRIDAANWDIEQAKQNNQELEALYEKRREIEGKYNNNASQFQDDEEWKNNEKNIESKKAYIKSVEDSASAYIEALMGEDDALYDSNGKIIKGKEELVNRLLNLYKKFDEYNSTETPDDKEVFDKYYNDTINRFKSDTSDLSTEELDSLNKQFDEQTQSLANAIENLQNEYDKISDWGLDDYADQIKNNTIQTKFGNVDMDKRTIIHWSDELKQTYADALASWDYDPEVGSIDTVFGGSERFGEELNGNGWEVAFTPILPDGTFLSKDTVEEYINSILEEAYADDGKVTEDELTAIDAQGRQVGDTFVKGIFAGIDDSQNYDNNGNWAEVVGRLMHFAGNFGAKQLADQGIDDANTKLEETKKKIEEVSKRFDDSQKIKDFFDTEGINTDEEINEFNKVTEGINRADEAIQKWNEHKKESATNSSFTKDPTSLLTESNDKSKTANLADLKSEADTLKSLQKELEDTGVIGVDSMQSIIKQYPEAKEALYDYMTGVKNEAELFADLENIYNDDKNQYINSMVEQNQANEDFFASLKAKYPEVVTEMQNLVDQTNALLGQQKENYINSIVSEEESCQTFLNFIKETYPELYAQLSEIYGNDEENFIRHIISENETNQEFIDALSKLYPDLANNLATTYGNDVSNWTSMEQAKAQITANLINQLNEMWSEYFDGISETFGAFGSIMENADGSGYTFLGGQDDSMYYDHNMTEDEWQASQKAVRSYNAVKEKMQKSINLANASVKDLRGAAYDSIESSVGDLDYNSLGKDISSDSDKGSSDDSDSGSEPTPEDFDWIERAIKKIERTVSNLSSVVDDTYSSWSTRNNALVDELNAVSEEIGIQEQAAQKYFELADNVGLEEDYQNLVKNGDFNVETVTDDGLKERIKEFQDFYDKATEAQDKVEELRKSYNDLNNQRLDHLTSEFEQLNNANELAIKYAQNALDNEHGSYYAKDSIIAQQQNNYMNSWTTKLQKRQKLIDEFNSTGIDINSEAGYKWLTTLQGIDEEIINICDNIKNLNNTKFDNLNNEFKNIYQWLEEQNNIWSDKTEDTFLSWSERDIANSNLKNVIQQQIQQYTNHRNDVMKLFQEAQEDGNSEAAQKYYSEIFSIDEALRTLKKSYDGTSTTILDHTTAEFEQSYNDIDRIIKKTETIINDSTKSYKSRNNALILQIKNNQAAIAEQQAQKAKLEKELAESGIKPNTEAWYKWQQQIQACDDNIESLQENATTLNNQKFENIKNQFEEINTAISNSVDILNKYISIAETKGLFADKSLYEKSINFYNQQLQNEINERDRLTEEMNNAVKNGVSQSSEQFYSMKSEVDKANSSILETVNTIEGLKKSITELDFSKFEYLQSRFSDVTSEGKYYIDLMDKMDKDSYDENGNITKEGVTAAALHLHNKDVYLNEAKFYADKIKDINSQLAEDPTNKTLIDKKKEYVEALREANLSAMDEKKSVEDLVKNGYQKQLDYIQKIINKKKEQMEEESDAYEYQKSIAEKTANLNKLYKQRSALTQMNDDTEENLKRIQELKVSIEDAEKDLQETEYEKMKSDRQKQLDNLQDEFSNMIDNMTQNIDENLNNIVNEVNSSSTAIISTLKELSEKSGLALSETLKDIYSNGSSYSNLNINTSDIGENYSKTNESMKNLKLSVDTLISTMEDESKEKMYGVDATASLNSTIKNAATSIDNLNNGLSNVNDSIKELESILKNGYYLAEPPEEITEERIKIPRLGYAKGTKKSNADWAWTQEDGEEIIRTKDGALLAPVNGAMVFTNEMSENLWNLSQGKLINAIGTIPTPALTSNNSSTSNITYDVNIGDIKLEGVNNPDEFAKQLRYTIANDNKTKRIMKAATIDQLAGKSAKEVYKYV